MADIAGSAAAAVEEQELDLPAEEVLTKYSSAGEIATRALKAVVDACVPGKKIVEICALGDEHIKNETKGIFKTAKNGKGIAFPTCVSVNQCCGHYSPLEEESAVLAEGDVAKIDLGVHIDGFIALVAHTVVVGATAPITGRKADAISAAHYASEIVLRTLKPGVKNYDVTKHVEKAIAAFKCEPVDGVVSHQLKQLNIDGPKCVMNKNYPDKKVAEIEFAENEVYAVDIVVSTGDGRARERDARATVFRRQPDASYALKLKASRQLYHEIKDKYPSLPFSLREFESQRTKMGVVECVKHDLLQSYPVLYERDGEIVAQVKFTVMLLANGARRITHHPIQALQSEFKIEDEELKAILAQSASASKKKKKSKAKAADAPSA